MQTAQRILELRGALENPIGQELGVTPRVGQKQQVDIIVGQLPNGHLALDETIKTFVNGHSSIIKIGHRVINPEDETNSFR
jgi:hypothetical protein